MAATAPKQLAKKTAKPAKPKSPSRKAVAMREARAWEKARELSREGRKAEAAALLKEAGLDLGIVPGTPATTPAQPVAATESPAVEHASVPPSPEGSAAAGPAESAGGATPEHVTEARAVTPDLVLPPHEEQRGQGEPGGSSSAGPEATAETIEDFLKSLKPREAARALIRAVSDGGAAYDARLGLTEDEKVSLEPLVAMNIARWAKEKAAGGAVELDPQQMLLLALLGLYGPRALMVFGPRLKAWWDARKAAQPK